MGGWILKFKGVLLRSSLQTELPFKPGFVDEERSLEDLGDKFTDFGDKIK